MIASRGAVALRFEQRRDGAMEELVAEVLHASGSRLEALAQAGEARSFGRSTRRRSARRAPSPCPRCRRLRGRPGAKQEQEIGLARAAEIVELRLLLEEALDQLVVAEREP